jgi:glycosyl-4,4'-diaponeurosporenoate acyltransferase
MPTEPSLLVIALINTLAWPVIQLGLAWAFTRMPDHWFARDAMAKPCPCENRFLDRVLHIKHWKDRLPDAASWFAGGFAKAKLTGSDPEYLRRFIRETRRGELCHWCVIACVALFLPWNPWWADLVIVTYAIAANLPCILVQRYNRERLSKLLAHREAKAWIDQK